MYIMRFEHIELDRKGPQSRIRTETSHCVSLDSSRMGGKGGGDKAVVEQESYEHDGI